MTALRRLSALVIALAGSLAVVVAAPAAIASATGATSTSQLRSIPVPAGWKTYTFDRAAISVPATWAVTHDSDCLDSRAPGLLILGAPKTFHRCPDTANGITGIVTVASTSRGDSVFYVGTGSPKTLSRAVGRVKAYAAGTDARTILSTLRSGARAPSSR